MGSPINRSVSAPGELRNWALGTEVQNLHCVSDLDHRLLDITPASSLSFVLDTTGSMGEEINAAKVQARRIVEQRQGSPMEPVFYVLVPFHDPGSVGLQGWGKEGPGRRLEACSEETLLRATLPVVMSEPLRGTCVHAEVAASAVSKMVALSPVQCLLGQVPLASLDFCTVFGVFCL